MVKMWLIFLSLTIGNTIAKATGVSYWPENTVALRGNTLTIKCGVYAYSHSSPLNWKFYPVGSKLESERFIYSNGVISNTFRHFTINQTHQNQYDLTTASVTLTDAGSYRCTKYKPVPGQTDSFQAVVFEAQVIVLASDPVCTTNISTTDNTIEERNWLELSCQVNYSGNWPPDLEWSQTGKRRGPSMVNEVISLKHFHNQSSRYTSIVAVDSSDHGSSFGATMHFSLKNLDHASNNATNVPRYVFKWTSNTTNVLYGARNVTVTPSGNVFKPGDSLVCGADGNPEPTYQWTELSGSTDNSMLIVHGSFLNVSNRMVREELYTFQCTALNEIDTKKCSATVRIVFNVREMGFPSVYWVFIGFGAVVVFLLLILTSTCTYIVAKRNQRKAEILDFENENSGTIGLHISMEDRITEYEEIAETASNVLPRSVEPAIRQKRRIVADVSGGQELVDIHREGDDNHEKENEPNTYEPMVNIEAERPSVYTPVFLESHMENSTKNLPKQETNNYLELLE